MQAQRHYSKAPIMEAIIDLRVTLPGDVSVNKLSDIHPYISNKFPTVQSIHRGVGSLAIQAGMSAEVNASEQHLGFWFRSEDNLRTFQATLEGFTFNRLAPYESWEEFSSEARSLWEIYKEICRPTYVTRTAIRYINQINIPANGLIELKDYLNTVPEVPSDLPEKTLQTYFMQLQIPQQDLNCILIINEALAQPTNPGIITVILDFDLFRQQIWESNDEDIWQFLEKLRRRKNEVFEASITDKTRELID